MPTPALPPPAAIQPVTPACVTAVANHYQLPTRLLWAVMAVEGGRVGEVRANANGSFDLGPMQINTWWLNKLQPYVSAEQILYNGCINVQVGAWILKQTIQEAGGDFWKGVGYYHSHTPERHRAYQQKVYYAANQLPDME